MKLQKPKGQKGADTSAFTIADVLVAVLVLGIISGAFYTALSSSFLVLQSSREDLRATQILMQRIEAVRLCTWSQVGGYNFQEKYDPLSSSSQAGSTYYGSVTIGPATDVANSASYYANMYLVTVNLNWTNTFRGASRAHSRQMQTHVARYGLQNYIWGAVQ